MPASGATARFASKKLPTPATSKRAAGFARREGIKLFWKPHLAYWGSFAWRGDITFGDDEAAWRRFFDDYRKFIVDQARFAERWRIPLFPIGLEYEKDHPPASSSPRRGADANEWRRIIAEIRRVYSGKITYAAKLERSRPRDLLGCRRPDRRASLFSPESRALPDDRHHTPRLGTPPSTNSASSRGATANRYSSPRSAYDVAAGAAREPWRGERRDTPQNRRPCSCA